MLTDYHCHILPNLDDGAKNMEVSLAMIQKLREQGVKRVVATPHFYAHREASVEAFLRRRQASFECLQEYDLQGMEIVLGAEVAIERDISVFPEIERLVMGETNMILVEYPYYGYARWMSEEVYHLSYLHSLVPVIAHIHRYINYYDISEVNQIMEQNSSSVFQVNCEAFGLRREKQIAQKLLKGGYLVVFGSDAHNMDSRKPNVDTVIKKCKKEFIDRSDKIIEKFK